MERISDEIVINSLFVAGFNVVDTCLFNYVLEKIVKNEKYSSLFIYENARFSESFRSNVEYKDDVYEIKTDTDNAIVLSKSDTLVGLVKSINLEEIVRFKMYYYGLECYYGYDYCFSSKEKEIMRTVFRSHFKDIVKGIDPTTPTVKSRVKEND